MALAAQKHGEHKAAKNAPKAKADAKQARSDLLSTFALLHCGSGGSWRYWHDVKSAAPLDVDPGWFHAEFDKAVERTPYSKNAVNYRPALDGAGMPHPAKLRSLPEIIADWGRMIQPHMHLFRRNRVGGTDEPFFQPAPAPGPLVPTEASIASFVTLREALRTEQLFVTDRPSSEEVAKFKEYVLAPSEAGLSSALAVAKSTQTTQPTQAQTGATSTTTDAVDSAAETATATQRDTAQQIVDQDMLLLQQFRQLHQNAGAHAWPMYQPTAAQVAHEAAVVNRLSLHDNVSEAAARRARLDRVNSAVRAAAIAKFDAGKPYLTKNGDLEKMKWSLIYEEHTAGVEPFGAEYVEATRWNRDSAKKKMLLEVYKGELLFSNPTLWKADAEGAGTASARAARVHTAITKQRKSTDPALACLSVRLRYEDPFDPS